MCGAAQSSAAQRSTPYAGQDLMEVGGMEGNGWNGWMDGWMDVVVVVGGRQGVADDLGTLNAARAAGGDAAQIGADLWEQPKDGRAAAVRDGKQVALGAVLRAVAGKETMGLAPQWYSAHW